MSIYTDSKRRNEFGGRYRRIKPNPNFKKAARKKCLRENINVIKTEDKVQKVKAAKDKTIKTYKNIKKEYDKFKKDPMIKDFWGNIRKSLSYNKK